MTGGGVRHSSVTVVIPAFNAERFIETSLQSAIRESPASVVVVDDGSTDATAVRAKEVAARSAVPVEVTTIRHGGEAAARNAGLHVAKTDWVAFLDADDHFLPGRMARLLQHLQENPELDAVTSDAYMQVDGEIRGRCYGPAYRFVHHDQASAILRHNFVFGHVVVRPQRLIDLGGFNEAISHTADWAMWIDLVLSGGQIGYVPEPLAVYRVHARSASANQLQMARGAVATLRHAQQNSHLTPARSEILAGSLAAAQRTVDLRSLDTATESGTGVRSAARAVASNASQSPQSRCKAIVAMASPRLMAAWKQWSTRGMDTGTAGWLIPRSPSAVGQTKDTSEPAPLVSVVIAFLDEHRFLRDAIATVEAQTMTDWELLLVDDGSTDGSGELADEVALASSRVRVLRHPGGQNEGLAASRNLGIRHARAATVAFLDADDRWEVDKLDMQLRALAEHPSVGMVAGATRHRFLDEARPDEVHQVADFGRTVLPKGRFARELLRERIPMPPPPSSVLYRTATLRAAGGVPHGNSTYEDQRTFVVTSVLSPTLIVDDVVTTYARRSDSLYGRLANDNITKSQERREFEWWALRSLGSSAVRQPGAAVLALWLIAHRLRVAIGRRFDGLLSSHSNPSADTLNEAVQ